MITAKMNPLVNLLLYQWRQRDALTGLCNRKRVYKDLDRALRRSTRVGLILADIDEFRKVNDRHGHEFGDTVLRRIAKVLTARCATTTVLGPYRDAGQSFSFVLARGVENSYAIGEALRADVEQLRVEPHPETKVTIRLAVAVSPEDGKTREELWERAFNLLYAPPRKRNHVASSVR
jgi:diguanylate cyclase (GGDEF)-like protein